MNIMETIHGERERATVEGVRGSDIPTQYSGKTCCVEDLHLALVVVAFRGERKD